MKSRKLKSRQGKQKKVNGPGKATQASKAGEGGGARGTQPTAPQAPEPNPRPKTVSRALGFVLLLHPPQGGCFCFFLCFSSLLAYTALVSLCPGVLCHRPLDIIFHAWLFAGVSVPLVYTLPCFSLFVLAGELREGMPLAGDRLAPRGGGKETKQETRGATKNKTATTAAREQRTEEQGATGATRAAPTAQQPTGIPARGTAP